MKTKKRVLGLLLSLALVLGLMPGMSLTAYADTVITTLQVGTVYQSGTSFNFEDYIYLDGPLGGDSKRTKGSGTISYNYSVYGDADGYIRLSVTNLEYYSNYFNKWTETTIDLNKDVSISASKYTMFKVISGSGTQNDPFIIDSYVSTYPTVTAPTARNLIYNGQAQKLVTAGTVTGGTMYYAVTTENTAPAKNLYTTSIPTATDAGTYYVWYKAVGDSNHSDSEAACVEVTISEEGSSGGGSGGTSGGSSGGGGTGTPASDTSADNTGTPAEAKIPYVGVPISAGFVKDITGTPEATAESNPFDTRIENNNILTELLSLQEAEIGQGVNVWLDVQDISAVVSPADRTLVESVLGDYAIGTYLDINLFKRVGNDDAIRITETNGKLQVGIIIPEFLWKSGRTFELIRLHDGAATTISGTYDETTHSFTFETDKFSVYALAYKDNASSNAVSNSGSNSIKTTTPKTEDSNDIRLWLLLLFVSLGGLGAIAFFKKNHNK